MKAKHLNLAADIIERHKNLKLMELYVDGKTPPSPCRLACNPTGGYGAQLDVPHQYVRMVVETMLRDIYNEADAIDLELEGDGRHLPGVTASGDVTIKLDEA